MLVGDKVAEHMLNPHDPSQLAWDDIYPHWRHDDLKYYWERLRESGSRARPELRRSEAGRKRSNWRAPAMKQAIYALARGAKNSPDTVAPEVLALLDELGVKV